MGDGSGSLWGIDFCLRERSVHTSFESYTVERDKDRTIISGVSPLRSVCVSSRSTGFHSSFPVLLADPHRVCSLELPTKLTYCSEMVAHLSDAEAGPRDGANDLMRKIKNRGNWLGLILGPTYFGVFH